MHPPDPEMRRAGSGKPTLESQNILGDLQGTPAELDLQARKLRRLYALAYDTARTIAAIAYGMAR